MKLGLVLEGGANRGNFSVGAMDVLMENEVWADYVIGASAGIANGVSYVTRQHGRGLKIATDYMPTRRYSGWHHLLNPFNRSLYNIKFVFDELPNRELPFDYEAYARFTGGVKAVVTNMRTGEAEYLECPRDDTKCQTVLASCALPFMFEPVKIGTETYMDGGISDPIPAQHALDDGCDKIIVITTRERSYVKQPEKAVDAAAKIYNRRYPEFARALRERTDVYNACRERVFALEKQGKAFVIEPESTAGFSRTEKDKDKIYALYMHGKNVANSRMDALKRWLCDGESFILKDLTAESAAENES